jgi:hypothetical protein
VSSTLGGIMEPVVLLDAAGRRRSATTLPGHRGGRAPRNKGARAIAAHGRESRRAPPARFASVASCPRGADGEGRSAAQRHPALTGARRPPDHLRLPGGDRQRRDHRHRSRAAGTDDPPPAPVYAGRGRRAHLPAQPARSPDPWVRSSSAAGPPLAGASGTPLLHARTASSQRSKRFLLPDHLARAPAVSDTPIMMLELS